MITSILIVFYRYITGFCVNPLLGLCEWAVEDVKFPLESVIDREMAGLKKGVMLSIVEAWWAGLCALPFDGAQGDTSSCLFMGYYSGERLFGFIEPVFAFAKAGYQHGSNRIASGV